MTKESKGEGRRCIGLHAQNRLPRGRQGLINLDHTLSKLHSKRPGGQGVIELGRGFGAAAKLRSGRKETERVQFSIASVSKKR
jgi:hypothetical protein